MADENQPIVPTINEEYERPMSTNPALQPGTPWGDLLTQNAERVRAAKTTPLRESFRQGVQSTTAAGIVRNVQQRVEPDFDTVGGAIRTIGETAIAATGQAGKWGESNWDKEKYYDELTEGLSESHKDSVMSQTTLEGARLARGNIQDDLARYERMGLSRGTAQVLQFSGMLADVDAPLMLMSGGSFGAAKVAGRAAALARTAATGRVAGTAAGISGGLQVGALVGGLDALNRDTTTWMDAVRMTLMTTAAGGALGAAAPKLMLPMKQIERDFVRRMQNGDDSVWGEPVTLQPTDPNAGTIRVPSEEELTSTVGAAQATPNAGLRPNNDTVVDIGGTPVTGRQSEWIRQAKEWVFNSGYKERYAKAMENNINKMFAMPFLNPGTNNVMRMVKSQSAVANWLAGTVYEVASGVVRGDTSTAAVLQRQFHGRLQRYINDEQSILGSWAKRTGQANMDPTGNFVVRVKPEGQRQFYREVILDMDAAATIHNGGTAARSIDPDVRRMADKYMEANSEALAILKGRDGELSVAGFEGAVKGTPYVPYRWHAPTFLGALSKLDDAGQPLLNNDMLIDGFTRAYMSKGTFTDPEIAKLAASALVERFVARGRGQDDSILFMMTRDGRDFIENSLKGLGRYSDQEIENFMRRFDTQVEDRSKVGYAKSKSEIDLQTEITLRDGSTMKIIDFMDPDFSATQQRYLRQVAGNAALARKGILHKGDRSELISAMQAEQRAAGEVPIDRDLADAMFSEFDGAAQIGFAFGQKNAGIGALAEVKALSSLSMLQLNGFAQAAETGVGMFAVGLDNWFKRGIAPMFDKAMKDSNNEVFEEMMFLTGEIGKDQYTFRPHLALDEATDYRANDKATRIMSQIRSGIAQGNNIQGWTSGLNHVREFQQKVAWLGMSDKIMRTIKNDIDGLPLSKDWAPEGRMYRDLGLTEKHYNDLRGLIEDGTIELKTTTNPLGRKTTYVNRLNIDAWDGDLAQDFMSALARNEAQLVQRPLAGETDRWMHTHLGSLLTHLQTFPILAIQKQGARHAGQLDAQAGAQALGGIATAYLAINLRDLAAGRERTGVERAKAAIAYSNLAGWVPMYTDPLMSVLGLHDYRINGFGAYAQPLQAPALDTINTLTRTPGALGSALFGEEELSGGDRSALRTLPFVRLADMLTGMAGMNLLDDPNRIKEEVDAIEATR